LFVVASIFLTAAVAKLRHQEAFRQSLSAIRSIPTWSIGLVALGVPLAELTAAGLLLVSPRVGAAIALGLLVSFSVVAERLHRLGQKVHCACFGNLGGDRLGRGTVARNLGLSLLCLPLLILRTGWTSESFPLALAGLLIAANLVLLGHAVRELTASTLPSQSEGEARS